MQSTKTSQAKSYRRSSMPVTTTTAQNKRRGSGAAVSSNSSAAAATKSTAVKSTAVKPTAASSTTAPASVSAAAVTAAAPPAAAAAAATTGVATSIPAATTSDPHKAPLVMTPVSQISKGPRRNSRPEVPIPEGPASWDSDSFNPDGSLRTMHRMPGFDQSYAQAMKARYVRHREPLEREKELSVNEIFGRKEPH